MDTLHDVLRQTRETKERPNHLSVFREFLDHLDRIGKSAKQPPARRTKTIKRKRSAKT